MNRPIGFVDFVERVLLVTLTPAQRVLCLVAYDGVEPCNLTGADREIARKLFGDVDRIPPEARHVIVVVAGARAGKSYVLCALRLLYLALTTPLETLAPGEVAAALIIAPDLRLARQTLRYISGAAKGTRAIASRVSAESSDSLTLRRESGRSVTIECLPATRGGSAVRGRSLVGAVLDECAFFRDESFVVNDAEVFKAVAPRVMTNGQIVVSSTPFAETGLLFDLFTANHGDPHTCLAAHAPTTLLRDDARTRSMVERERERDPDNALREFDAQFMASGAGLFFDANAIEKAVDRTIALPLTPTFGTIVSAGADFAFRTDSSALIVVHKSPDGVATVADIIERKPGKGEPLKPSEVVQEFAATLKRHGANYLRSDGHYRQAIEEHLYTHALSFVAAPEGATGKLETHTRARALLHEGKVRLPNHPRLLKQMRELISRPTSGGGLSISSPRWRTGGHGDLVSALVLALHERNGTTVKAPKRSLNELTPEERVERWRISNLMALEQNARQGDERVRREIREAASGDWMSGLERDFYGDDDE